MDVKDAGSMGGKKAWRGTNKAQRSAIMSERNKKAWRTTRRSKTARPEVRPDVFPHGD